MQRVSPVISPTEHSVANIEAFSAKSASDSQRTPRRAKTSSRSRGVSSSASPNPDALSRYLGELGRHSTFTRKQELEAAEQIARLELDFWTQSLTCPAALGSCRSRLHQTLENDELAGEARESDLLRRLLEPKGSAADAVESPLSAAETDALVRRLRECDKDRSSLRAVYDATLSWCDWATSSEQLALRQLSRKHERKVRKAFRLQSEAKQRFAAANLRLVVSMAKRYNRGGLPLVDLIQEGNLGLMTAIERFDPEQGCRFSTYAGWWIRHAVSRAIADKSRTVRIPVHKQELRQRLARLERKSLSRFGRKPTIEELVQQTGVSERKLRLVVNEPQQRSLALDRSVGDDDGLTFLDLLVDESAPAPDETLASDQWKGLLERHLSALRAIESHILRYRFGLNGAEERTLKQLGDELSLSRERVRQLQNRALETLRRRIDAEEESPVQQAAAS